MTGEEEYDADEPEIVEDAPAYSSILDSRQGQLDDVLNAKLEDAFNQGATALALHDVAKIGAEHDPIDLAFAVARLPRTARVIVYENLPDIEAKIIFMINTSSNTRTAIFRDISDEEIQDLIGRMQPDEAVWLLDDMSDRRMKRILHILDPQKKERILDLQKHDRNSAGRLMNDEVFAFSMSTTIGEVGSFIRDHPGTELTRGVFVISNAGELIGYVPDRNLIVNMPYVPIRQVMRPVQHKVFVSSSRDEVVDLVERYKIPALPVVDENNILVGVITYDDVVEAMEDIADETIASIAGTAEDVSEHEPIYRRFLWRAPWLLVTICAGFVSATIMSHFSGPVWFAFVPFFVPLITGMSGNVGIQCSTILVRGISTGEVSFGSRHDAILREIGIGLMIGSIFGLCCGILIFSISTLGLYQDQTNPLIIGTTLGVGVFMACLSATLLGAFSPFFFARLGIDPAVASGPIVTAFNDVLSFLMFVLVAYIVHTSITFLIL